MIFSLDIKEFARLHHQDMLEPGIGSRLGFPHPYLSAGALDAMLWSTCPKSTRSLGTASCN